MALKLSTQLPIGITADYWRISKIELDRNADIVSITVGLYVSQAARAADSQVVTQKTYSSTATENPTVAEAYALLKADADFAGAVDA